MGTDRGRWRRIGSHTVIRVGIIFLSTETTNDRIVRFAYKTVEPFLAFVVRVAVGRIEGNERNGMEGISNWDKIKYHPKCQKVNAAKHTNLRYIATAEKHLVALHRSLNK